MSLKSITLLRNLGIYLKRAMQLRSDLQLYCNVYSFVKCCRSLCIYCICITFELAVCFVTGQRPMV